MGKRGPKPKPPKPCSVEGCGNFSRSRGWCSGHYSRWLLTGTTDPGPLAAARIAHPEKKCTVEGCDRRLSAKGMCQTHYTRLLRTGNTDPTPKTIATEAHRQNAVCSVDGCVREVRIKGLCATHYARVLRRGTLETIRRPPSQSPEEERARKKEWSHTSYTRNRDKALARVHAYRTNNEFKVKSKRQEHYRQNRLLYRARARKAYLAKKDEYCARAKRWREANPSRTRVNCQRRRAREAAAPGVLSPDIVDRLITKQRGRCVVCRARFAQVGFHLDHIVPLARGGSNADSNVQLLCPSCNLQKSAKDPVEFMQEKGFLL